MALQSVLITTNAPTGSGTEDTLTSGAFKPSGEASVQERLGDNRPFLVGYDSLVVEVSMDLEAYIKFNGNTWPVSDYIQHSCLRYATTKDSDTTPTVVKISQNNGPKWFDKVDMGPKQMVPEEDWEIALATQTASIDIALLLYLKYGFTTTPSAMPWTWRRVVKGANVTADAWTEMGSISDLSPEKYYRIAALALFGGTNPIAVKIESPSLMGNNIAALASQNYDPHGYTFFPYDSGIITGRESPVVYAYAGAASQPVAYVAFQETGAIVPGGRSRGAGGVPGGVQPGPSPGAGIRRMQPGPAINPGGGGGGVRPGGGGGGMNLLQGISKMFSGAINQ